MNGTQVFIAVAYTVLALLSVGAFIWLFRSTRGRQLTPLNLERLRERESRVAAVIAGLLVVLLAATAFAIPYGDTGAEDAQVVRVEAFQFGWTLKPSRVEAGRPVEFRIRSRDVQHGLGLYQGAKLLEQVQVPARDPGSDAPLGPEQRMVHEFEEPGTYEILCLEFCGFGHHKMAATLQAEGGHTAMHERGMAARLEVEG